MAENFLELTRDINPQVQKMQSLSAKVDKRENTLNYIVVHLQNPNNQEILEAARVKSKTTQKVPVVNVTADLTTSTMEAFSEGVFLDQWLQIQFGPCEAPDIEEQRRVVLTEPCLHSWPESCEQNQMVFYATTFWADLLHSNTWQECLF